MKKPTKGTKRLMPKSKSPGASPASTHLSKRTLKRSDSAPKSTHDRSANLGKYLHMPKGGKVGTEAVKAVARAIRAKKGTHNAY